MGLKSIKDLRGLTANDMTRYAGLYYRACILVKYGQVPRSSRAAESCFDTTAKYHQVDDVRCMSQVDSDSRRSGIESGAAQESKELSSAREYVMQRVASLEQS